MTNEPNHLATPAQHRARAKQLRQHNPQSRAAELHEMAATAIEAKDAASQLLDRIVAESRARRGR
jgi:hypothetical protein